MFPKESRFRAAALAVWERSHAEYAGWPPGERCGVQPAVQALLAELRRCDSEDQLQERYWELGDPLGKVLRERLPADFDDERLLTLEEACLWLRLRELRQGG
jgi:hypothetical protein